MTLPPPQTPQLLYGHKTLEKRLFELYAENKLPHALLLKGEEGVGKATLAYRFVRHILKLDSDADIMVHPDFYRVSLEGDDAAKQITVDDISGLRSFFQKSRSLAPLKIAFIDEAHLMNRHAANALLKVLEEPPAHSLLILSACSALPATILSRCVTLPVKPLDEKVLRALLENFECDLDVIDDQTLFAFARGSIARAYQFMHQGGPAAYLKLKDILGYQGPMRAQQALHFIDTLGDIDAKTFRFWADFVLFTKARVLKSPQAYQKDERFLKDSLALNLDLKLSLMNVILGAN